MIHTLQKNITYYIYIQDDKGKTNCCIGFLQSRIVLEVKKFQMKNIWFYLNLYILNLLIFDLFKSSASCGFVFFLQIYQDFKLTVFISTFTNMVLSLFSDLAPPRLSRSVCLRKGMGQPGYPGKVSPPPHSALQVI